MQRYLEVEQSEMQIYVSNLLQQHQVFYSRVQIVFRFLQRNDFRTYAQAVDDFILDGVTLHAEATSLFEPIRRQTSEPPPNIVIAKVLFHSFRQAGFSEHFEPDLYDKIEQKQRLLGLPAEKPTNA